jgi:arylsulfatase
MISHLDWMPTLAEAAGIQDLPEKLKKGFEANGKTWKVHLDGESFLPYFKKKTDIGPRESYFYFGNDGTMNALRYKDFKVHFNIWEGASHAMGGARMVTPVLPLIVNLRSDPFESAMIESGAWENWAFENLWLFVPVQIEVKNFLSTIPDYPFQMGSTLSAGGVNYSLIEKAKAMKNMQDVIMKLDKLGAGSH